MSVLRLHKIPDDIGLPDDFADSVIRVNPSLFRLTPDGFVEFLPTLPTSSSPQSSALGSSTTATHSLVPSRKGGSDVALPRSGLIRTCSHMTAPYMLEVAQRQRWGGSKARAAELGRRDAIREHGGEGISELASNDGRSGTREREATDWGGEMNKGEGSRSWRATTGGAAHTSRRRQAARTSGR